MNNMPETIQRSITVERAKTWLIDNAERDQLTGSIIPGQAFRHPDGTIMTVRSPIDGMRIFELCSYCYSASKPSSMDKHVKNCRVYLDGASKAINNNINSDHVIIDPSSPPPLNIELSLSSPPVAAPGESSVDNPEPPLTVISQGGRKKMDNPQNIQRMNIIPDISVGDDNWNVDVPADDTKLRGAAKGGAEKAGASKGPWTDEEDRKVIELVQTHGPKKWSQIASELPGK